MSISAYQDPFLSEKTSTFHVPTRINRFICKRTKGNSRSSHLQIGTTSTIVKMSPENLIFALLDYYKCFFFTGKVCIRQPLTKLIRGEKRLLEKYENLLSLLSSAHVVLDVDWTTRPLFFIVKLTKL